MTSPADGLASKSRPARQPLLLELLEFELQKLHSLDVHSQTFKAQVWMEFVVSGGARDPYLSAKGNDFPVDENGNPTFKPPLGWYMAQVDAI